MLREICFLRYLDESAVRSGWYLIPGCFLVILLWGSWVLSWSNVYYETVNLWDIHGCKGTVCGPVLLLNGRKAILRDGRRLYLLYVLLPMRRFTAPFAQKSLWAVSRASLRNRDPAVCEGSVGCSMYWRNWRPCCGRALAGLVFLV